jgi:hypothetical protein
VPPLDDAGRGQDPQRDRQIERGARLADVGGGETHRNPVRRVVESGVANRQAHALAALADRGVGQADHDELRQPERDIHFHVHWAGVDAEDGGGSQAGEHVRRRCKPRGMRRVVVFSVG